MKGTFHIDYENTPFLQTSVTTAHPNRLNWRCEVLLTRNKEAIEGKKILDLASHDGRFSWACLRLGARRVTGVEGRHHLVKFANKNLSQLGYTSEHFDFVQGDVFSYLPQVEPKVFDTILCFGFFYHTMRQIELLREIERLQPRWFILDTGIARGISVKQSRWREYTKRYWYKRQMVNAERLIGIPVTILRKFAHINVMQLTEETPSRKHGNACLVFQHESHLREDATIDSVDLIARPTQPLVQLLLNTHGFEARQLYWNRQGIKDWTALWDYKLGNRVSYIAHP